jgi:PKD repeat protein
MFDKNGKTKLLTILLILSTMITAIFFISVHIPKTSAATTVFSVYASKTTGLAINETFTIIIQIKDFENIWVWQSGLQWNASLLECNATTLTFGKSSYPQSIFAVLAASRNTLTTYGTIDNVAGKIFPPYAESLTSPGTGVNGTPSTKYNLLKVDFKVKGYFPSGTNMTPINTKWTAYPSVGTGKPHTVESLTIYSVSPPVPKPPVANFTWTPPSPSIGQTITFNASSSQPGSDGTNPCPITEYRWDFNGDSVFDKNVSTPITTWTYSATDTYQVKLEVYAPGATPTTNYTTKTITIASPPPPLNRTFIFADPPRINATTIGEEITVYIKIKDFAQLWVWQVGLQWDPTKLNCTNVLAFKQNYPESVFAVIAPGRNTITVSGTINNTIGKIFPPYSESLTIPGIGVDSIPGQVYNLMKITFKVKATGMADLHLYGASCYYYPNAGSPGKLIIRDIFTVTLETGDYPIEIITNSTGQAQNITGHTFTYAQNKTSFVITCVSKRYFAALTDGFCNVTIPRSLMWDGVGQWIVRVNGVVLTDVEIKVNSTSTFIHFVYPHKADSQSTKPQNNLIEIISPHAIPEFSTQWLLMALLIAMLMLALLSKTKSTWLKQKRKL